MVSLFPSGNNGLKKLESNLYEIRSQRLSNIQRELYFQVQGTKYVITNAFTKKSQRTPESKKKIARNRCNQFLRQKEEHNE